jgi:hypothetical protein
MPTGISLHYRFSRLQKAAQKVVSMSGTMTLMGTPTVTTPIAQRSVNSTKMIMPNTEKTLVGMERMMILIERLTAMIPIVQTTPIVMMKSITRFMVSCLARMALTTT